MLTVVSAVLLMAGLVSGQTKYCCTTPEWESINVINTGSSVNGGTGKLLNGTQATSVSSARKMVAVDSNLNNGGVPLKFKLIQDFNGGDQYTIMNGGCTKASLGPWEPKCIPDTATKVDSDYYGLGNEAIPVDVYMFMTGANVVFVTVSQKDCTPISAGVYGSAGGVDALSAVIYGNFTVGIKEPSVFTIPDICKQAAHGSAPTTPMPVF